ncbi:uncharacterized protein TNCV_1736111 [Trichonephila clavipes]|nr:uncharacterized protein TNCV_1736111 [Trichonephila clavipes]
MPSRRNRGEIPTTILPVQRSLNRGGLSVFEKEDFPIVQQELVCSGTDESRFNLWDHDGRIRVRHKADERCLPECVIKRHSGQTPRVMVWGAISYHGRSNLRRT